MQSSEVEQHLATLSLIHIYWIDGGGGLIRNVLLPVAPADLFGKFAFLESGNDLTNEGSQHFPGLRSIKAFRIKRLGNRRHGDDIGPAMIAVMEDAIPTANLSLIHI